MSNYCSGCSYQPEARAGTNACPMTTLYWNFLDKHEVSFAANPRTALMVKNLQRIAPEERQAIRERAGEMLKNLNSL
jgi:deoxyribodipyrimidine photolyase-related protein